MRFFGLYRRRGTKEHLKAKKCLIKPLSPIFSTILFSRLMLYEWVSPIMIDFIDWLETSWRDFCFFKSLASFALSLAVLCIQSISFVAHFVRCYKNKGAKIQCRTKMDNNSLLLLPINAPIRVEGSSRYLELKEGVRINFLVSRLAMRTFRALQNPKLIKLITISFFKGKEWFLGK